MICGNIIIILNFININNYFLLNIFFRFSHDALLALQEAAEAYLVKILEDANYCAMHAKCHLKTGTSDAIMPLASQNATIPPGILNSNSQHRRCTFFAANVKHKRTSLLHLHLRLRLKPQQKKSFILVSR